MIRKGNSHPLAHIHIWHSHDFFTIIAHINCISCMNIHIKYKISHFCMSPGLYMQYIFPFTTDSFNMLMKVKIVEHPIGTDRIYPRYQ